MRSTRASQNLHQPCEVNASITSTPPCEANTSPMRSTPALYGLHQPHEVNTNYIYSDILPAQMWFNELQFFKYNLTVFLNVEFVIQHIRLFIEQLLTICGTSGQSLLGTGIHGTTSWAYY